MSWRDHLEQSSTWRSNDANRYQYEAAAVAWDYAQPASYDASYGQQTAQQACPWASNWNPGSHPVASGGYNSGYPTDSYGNGNGNGSSSRPVEQSLYDRLGGIYAIAAVVNKFSDDILKSPIVGVDSANPQLR